MKVIHHSALHTKYGVCEIKKENKKYFIHCAEKFKSSKGDIVYCVTCSQPFDNTLK